MNDLTERIERLKKRMNRWLLSESRLETYEILAECQAEIARLEYNDKLFKIFREDVGDGFECLPGCNSHGHEDACPVTNPHVAWRQLRAEMAQAAPKLEFCPFCGGRIKL